MAINTSKKGVGMHVIHFTDGQAEVLRGKVTYAKSSGRPVEELRIAASHLSLSLDLLGHTSRDWKTPLLLVPSSQIVPRLEATMELARQLCQI